MRTKYDAEYRARNEIKEGKRERRRGKERKGEGRRRKKRAEGELKIN